MNNVVRSRNTGLPYTIESRNGDRIRVRDENGKLINHEFDKDCFFQVRAR